LPKTSQLHVAGSMEAAWNINSHEIVHASVAVTSFGVHLPGMAPHFGDLSHLERHFARPSDARFDNLMILDLTEQSFRRTDLRTSLVSATAVGEIFWK
jgi:hypothetical protein